MLRLATNDFRYDYTNREFVMKKAPGNLKEAAVLLSDPELIDMLKAQLILLAFGDNATVQRASIEMLLAMPRADEWSDLDDLSDRELLLMLSKEIGVDDIDF